jgi:MFS family permease
VRAGEEKIMKIYYGWVIVAITILLYTLAVGASIQAYGVFVIPVSDSFHLTRAEVNTGAIVLNIGMALAAPIVGRMVDRRSVRAIMAASAIVFGASLVVLGLSHNLWLSTIVLTFGLGGAVVGSATVTAPVLVARWFTIHRGRAMAISSIGVSAGPIVVIPLISLLLEAVGWRQCLVILGVAIGGALLLLAVLCRNAPGIRDVEPGAADAPSADLGEASGAAARPLAMGQLLRLPQFWTIAISAALAFAVLTADIVTLVPFAQGEGLPVTQAASTLSVYGIAALAGAMLFAWVGDRFDRAFVFALLSLGIGVASGLLLFGHGYAVIVACTLLLGVSGGATAPAYLALLADEFGAASLGSASGMASFLSTFISAIAIRFGGEVFDRTGSYRLMFVTFLLIGLFAAALMLATRPLARRYAVAAVA